MNTQTFSNNTNFLSSLEVEHFGTFQKILPISVPSPSIFLSQTCVAAAKDLAGHRLLVSAAVTHQKLPLTLLLQVLCMSGVGLRETVQDLWSAPHRHVEKYILLFCTTKWPDGAEIAEHLCIQACHITQMGLVVVWKFILA